MPFGSAAQSHSRRFLDCRKRSAPALIMIILQNSRTKLDRFTSYQIQLLLMQNYACRIQSPKAATVNSNLRKSNAISYKVVWGLFLEVDCFLESHSEVTTVIEGNNGGRPNIHLRVVVGQKFYSTFRQFTSFSRISSVCI